MKDTTAAKKPIIKKPEFVFTLKIENETYVGKGATGLEALKAIHLPELISYGTLTVTHGDKSKEMTFSSIQLKRLFNPHHQDVLIHDLMIGM